MLENYISDIYIYIVTLFSAFPESVGSTGGTSSQKDIK